MFISTTHKAPEVKSPGRKEKAMIKVMGFQRKKGDFISDDNRRVEYDNIELYVFTDEAQDVTGYFCDTLKLPFKEESFLGVNNVSELINREIALEYKVFGLKVPKLIAVRALEQKAKA